jgi:hypothetical protein
MLQVILFLFVASLLMLLVPNPLIGKLLARLINRSLPADEFISIRMSAIIVCSFTNRHVADCQSTMAVWRS